MACEDWLVTTEISPLVVHQRRRWSWTADAMRLGVTQGWTWTPGRTLYCGYYYYHHHHNQGKKNDQAKKEAQEKLRKMCLVE